MAISLVRLTARRWQATRRLLIICLLALVSIAALPLGDVLLWPLEGRFPAHPAVKHVDGIILLGGGADPLLSKRTGMPELNGAGDRYMAAATLARRFPKSQVLFAGGSGNLTGPRFSEANVAGRILTDLGVERNRLHLEARSRTTSENATLLRKQWSQPENGNWLLVTSAFHMPRAMGSFCKAGWSNLIAWPVDYRAGRFADGIGWDLGHHLTDLDTGLKEWFGLAAYYASGRSTSLFPASCPTSRS